MFTLIYSPLSLLENLLKLLEAEEVMRIVEVN